MPDVYDDDGLAAESAAVLKELDFVAAISMALREALDESFTPVLERLIAQGNDWRAVFRGIALTLYGAAERFEQYARGEAMPNSD